MQERGRMPKPTGKGAPPARSWVSLGAGCIISIGLASLEAFRHSLLWALPQLPGFLVAALVWGVHAGGNAFEAVMVVVNASIYALLVFILLNFARWLKKPN